jgi:hypothetical protein
VPKVLIAARRITAATTPTMRSKAFMVGCVGRRSGIYLPGRGVRRRKGFRVAKPRGNLSLASSSEMAGEKITWSRSFQSPEVETLHADE